MSDFVKPYEKQKSKSSIEIWANNVEETGSQFYSSKEYFSPRITEKQTSIYDFIIVLFCLFIFAFTVAFYRKRFNLLLQTFFNWKLGKQIIRYEKVHSHPVNISLLLIFIICTPLFFCQSLASIYPEWKFTTLLKYFVVILATYFSIKYLLYQFSGWLFQEKELIDQYIFQGNLYSKIVGLMYFVLLTLLYYAPISDLFLLQTGLVVLFIFLFLQLSRGVIIGLAEKKNLLVIILYLCTLEILPWLLMYKSIQSSL